MQNGAAALSVLVRMQLKQKMDLSFLKSRKDTAFKAVYFVLAFVLVVLGAHYVFSFLLRLKIVSITSRLPVSLLVLIFTLMQALALMAATAGLVRALYFSGDNQVLLTLPVSANSVFFSKLIVFYLYELKKNATYTLPVFVAFGIKNSFSWGFYPVLLVAFVFISLIPVVLGALLSIPLAYVVKAVRDRRLVQIAGAVLLAGALTIAFFRLVSLIPSNIDIIGSFGTYFNRIQIFLNSFEREAVPMTQLVRLACGDVGITQKPLIWQQGVILICVIAINAAVLLVVYALARPLFFKMASAYGEHNFKRQAVARQNAKLGKLLSSLKKELLLMVRSPAALFANVISAVLLPFAMLLLNKLLGALSTRLLGDLAALSFNLFLTLLILLCGNVGCACILSSEGKAVSVLKSSPESLGTALAAKLALNSALTFISALSAAIIIIKFNHFSAANGVALVLTILLFSFGHIFWSAQLDIVKPQYALLAATNPNEVASMAIAFVTSFLGGALFMAFAKESLNAAWIKIMLIAIVYFVVRLCLLVMNARVRFKEEL